MNIDSKKLQQLPNQEFNPTDSATLEKVSKDRLKSFASLLESISSLEDKKKALWLHIYENVLTDRNNCYCAFADLYVRMHGKLENHALHGQTLSKYLERMQKCTDQLLQLASMIALEEEKVKKQKAEEEAEEDIEPGDLYKKIGAGKFQ